MFRGRDRLAASAWNITSLIIRRLVLQEGDSTVLVSVKLPVYLSHFAAEALVSGTMNLAEELRVHLSDDC